MYKTMCLLISLGFSAVASSNLIVDITDTSGGFYVSDIADVSFNGLNNATLSENTAFGLTLLSNDPFLGDPGIMVPNNAQKLALDYSFFTSGSDNFELRVLDSSGGADYFSYFHDGTLFAPGAYTGAFELDLSALGWVSGPIGLEFSLVSNFNDSTFDASLDISNVMFLNNTTTPLPSPSGSILLLLGSLWIAARHNRES